MENQTILYAIPVSGVLALIYAFFKASWISKQPEGTEKMSKIAGHIADGALAFLKREYKVLVIFVISVAILLGFANSGREGTSPIIALSFVVGALCSALAGFFGMKVATKANVRTTNAARTGLGQALNIAFSGGLVMGLSVVGLGILGLSTLFIIYSQMFPALTQVSEVINLISGFSLGASSIALFARVGGGIYTKAADVGADLAGKVYEGIPEDDPRNPATIADNVGDNVGDVAGMGADLFESYVGAIIGTMVLGAAFVPVFNTMGVNPVIGVTLPLIIAAVGILVSIVGSFFVKVKEGGNPQTGLNMGEFGASIIMAVLSYFIIDYFLPASWTVDGFTYTSLNIFFAVI
ncbi:MAG: sodium-translocating pyrophosphatase, partial [Chlorobium limicola]|nr:sodium-translocating pyrophosphatase [Chlorobium limicola]